MKNGSTIIWNERILRLMGSNFIILWVIGSLSGIGEAVWHFG